MKKNLLIAVLFAATGMGCTSLSTLQGARTTKKGEMTHTVAGGSYMTEITSSGSSGAEGTVGETVSLPMIEYMFRYGVADNFDFGLKYSGTSYGGDVKYNLMDGNFALALGLGLNMVKVESTSASVVSTTTTTDIIVPVYMNYDLGSGSAYFVPKVISKTVSGGSTDVSLTQTGITLGYQFQKEKGFFVEYNMVMWSEDVSGTSVSYSVAQPALGYVW
ncbi:MAG: hypothetical protein HOO06_13615 [Bdellovibrionaceae bacterium]|jgi:hypothetical protein|nr:hypothetical protein [Pseudobdellovibrionaceae bacterium]